MSNYDRHVSDAKMRVTEVICMVVSSDEKKHERGIELLPGAVDDLNKAWDALTDCLVRQRIARGDEVLRLLDQLAEAKK